MDEQNQGAEAPEMNTAPVEGAEAVPGFAGAHEAQPPIDNDHVAPGATPFTEAEIAANAVPAETSAAPPQSSGDASAPTPTLSSDSASESAPTPGAPGADGGAAPDLTGEPIPGADPVVMPDPPSSHPAAGMLDNLAEFMNMAAHYEQQGNLNAFVTTARELIADIRASL